LFEGDLMQERLLALDVGEKRIGVAVSDPLGWIAQPVGLVERVGWGPDIKRIAAYAEAYQTRRILVGLPRNMDGSCGAQAEKTRAFAAKLAESGFEITFWDERLSTRTAERALIEGGVRRAVRKTLIDQTAAVVILQAYLDANQNDKGGCNHGQQ
jgi:putative Holliday junction resolvase